MTEDDKNLLTIRPYYLILVKDTQIIYLDKDYYCYMFETQTSAGAFSGNFKGKTIVQEARQFTLHECCSNFFAQGASGVKVCTRDKKTQTVTFTEDEAKKIKRRLYNNEANRELNRAQQTCQNRYLRLLNRKSFYVPVITPERKEKEAQHIQYCYATFKSEEKYYLLFSTLDEFILWNKTQADIWSPMEVDIAKFERIRKNNPVFINPLSNKMLLTHQLMKIMVSEK